jgi:hypothetical protein
MLYIREKNRSDSFDHMSVTKVIKTSLIQYALFAIIVTLIVLRTRYSSIEEVVERDNSRQLLMKSNTSRSFLERNFSACVYSVHMESKVYAWEQFPITIKFAPKKECYFDDQDGGSLFRIQLYSIYELTSQTTSYIGNGTYKADVMLTIPSRYLVMVFVTYTHHLGTETRRHSNPVLRQLESSPYELIVASRGEAANDNFSNFTKYCSADESGVARGRWVKCGGILPGVERCGPWQSAEFDFDKIHGFHWVPYRCQYHQYTSDEIKRCFAKKSWDSIVFAGDSHMRYRAYHWATRFYGHCTSCVKTHIKMVFEKVPRIEWVFDARGTRLPLNYKNISLPYEKYIHPRVRRSKFSTPFPLDALNSKVFILNFGHWLLRESYGHTDFIEKKLHAYAQAAKNLINEGKVVVWVNTVSLPWRMDQAMENWRENTSPSRVKHFNEIADRVMKLYGIPLVDAYHVSDGRIGATHDQTHYTKKLPGNEYGGVVENAISNVIFNKLCRG